MIQDACYLLIRTSVWYLIPRYPENLKISAACPRGVAEFPDFIREHVFETKNLSEAGKYEIRLYEPRRRFVGPKMFQGLGREAVESH